MGRGRDYLGSYRLIRMIRAGQTSQVWEAVNDTTREKVAIKSLVPEQRRNKQEIRNLRHEHTVAHGIDHENIVSIHHVDISGNIPYVVLDFVHGKNLKLMIRNEFETIAYQLPQLIIPMAISLGHLHKAGWVHCDVKPDNYMIDSELGVILIDFAIARKIRTGLGRLLSSIGNKVQGTRSYMAPEQIRGKALDGRTDIYGLGCSIYEMLECDDGIDCTLNNCDDDIGCFFPEACDDNNTVGGDGCDSLCQVEPGFACLSTTQSADSSGVGGLDLYFQMKGWFRPEGGHWSILGFAGGGCGRGADPNVCGAALEEAIEDARLSGGEKSGGGVLAGMRVGTAARSVEIPSLRGFLPERNLHLVEFPFEVLHAGAQDSTAVLGSAPRERVHTPFAGKLAAVVQDEVVKALLPLIAEQEVANGGGGGHSQECSWEWARGN